MQRATQAWLGVALLALVFALGLQKIRSYDYFWHLRTGALIVEAGAVPRADPYSYTAPGARWIDVHWLHQVGLHALYTAGGHGSVVLAKVAAIAALAVCVLTVGWRRARPLTAASFLFLLLTVAGDRFMPRPELPSFVLLAAVIALLVRDEARRDRWVFAILPLQLLWANLHGLFAVGVAVCGLALVAELCWEPVVRRRKIDRGRVRRLAVLSGLGLLVSLANPNGVDALLYPLEQLFMLGPSETRTMRSSELYSMIGTWKAMTPLAQGLFAALTGLSLAGMAANARRLRGCDVLWWAAFLLLAAVARRNVALFAIVAAALGTRNWNEVLDRMPARPRARTALTVAAALLVSAVALDVARGRFFHRLGSLRAPGFGILDILYPVAAADWIAERDPPGPLYHHIDDGGYLIWRLYPAVPVLHDGRLEVYGGDRLAALRVNRPEDFERLDAVHRFGTALVRYSERKPGGLLAHLYAHPGWRLAFVDEIAAVFVRRMPDEESADLDVHASDLFPPRDHAQGLEDAWRRMGRSAFYQTVGQVQRAEGLAAETRRLHPWLFSDDR